MEEAAVHLALQIADKALDRRDHRSDPSASSTSCAARCAAWSSASASRFWSTRRTWRSSREAVDGLVRQLGGIEHLEVQEERRVQRGGAMVRSTTGEIDARIQTKLERRARS